MSRKVASKAGLVGLVLIGGACALSACSSSDDSSSGGTAGTTGSGTAGKSGTAGTTGSGTAGTTGSGTAGTTGSGTAGTTGSGTAGATGTAGGTGTAGAGGGSGSGYACAGTKPTGALITDFGDLVKSTDATQPNEFTFGGTEGLPGGTFSYQKGALTYTTTDKSLEVKGNVKDYDGFGLYFGSCTDASAYTGVSFNIKGNVGASGKINFSFQTNADTGVNSSTMKGSCPVTPPADPNNDYAECHFGQFAVAVPAGGGVVSVKFSDLTGGLPVAGVDGKDLLGLQWAFTWAGATDTPYDVDVTVDDVMFTGGTGTGTGGAGGTAGAASGGTGGASGGTGGASGGTGGA